MTSLSSQLIWPHLKQSYESIMAEAIKVDFPEMSLMHERILLLPNSELNRDKAQFLNLLGDIYKMHYQTTQDIDGLHQAICLYDDAI